MITKISYQPVIGLEVHIELATNSKMFCGCPANHFHISPNTHTCPVCLGLPGALPVPNAKAIEWTALIGLSLGCSIPPSTKFDRKHYFYPDLPKGYQISQYDQPIAATGQLQLYTGELIDITRVHLEEDTGKLIHTKLNNHRVSLVDFNRSGVPLVEIVTEPCVYSAETAKRYLKAVQLIIRRLGVSSCDMEKGSMRLEANISVIPVPHSEMTVAQLKKHLNRIGLPAYKVEVKNLNSFRFVEKAINYETTRQIEILKQGKTPTQETRGFSVKKGITISQRSKEDAHDYRYFPEPDIPPFSWQSSQIKKIKQQLLSLPAPDVASLVAKYSLSTNQAVALVYDEKKWLLIQQLSSAKLDRQLETKLVKHILNLPANKLDLSLKQLINAVKTSSKHHQLKPAELTRLIKQIISNNPQAIASYHAGKKQVIGHLIGQALKTSQHRLDPALIRAEFEAVLNSKD